MFTCLSRAHVTNEPGQVHTFHRGQVKAVHVLPRTPVTEVPNGISEQMAHVTRNNRPYTGGSIHTQAS